MSTFEASKPTSSRKSKPRKKKNDNSLQSNQEHAEDQPQHAPQDKEHAEAQPQHAPQDEEHNKEESEPSENSQAIEEFEPSKHSSIHPDENLESSFGEVFYLVTNLFSGSHLRLQNTTHHLFLQMQTAIMDSRFAHYLILCFQPRASSFPLVACPFLPVIVIQMNFPVLYLTKCPRKYIRRLY